MKKLVINKCYGGFGLSPKAIQLYLKKIGKECFFYVQTGYKHNGNESYTRTAIEDIPRSTTCVYTQTKDSGEIITELPNDSYWYNNFYDCRDNKELVETVEELGEEESSGPFAELRIVEIPDDVEWELDEYDGIESVHEKHRSW